MGVQASFNGTTYYIGKPGWFEQMEVDLSGVHQDIKQIQERGKTVMMMVADQKPVGLIAVADTIKPESREAVEALQNKNIQVIMLTGDNIQTARAIAGAGFCRQYRK